MKYIAGTLVPHGAQDYRCPSCDAVRLNVRARWRLLGEEEPKSYKGEEVKEAVFCTACLTERNTYVEMYWTPTRAQHDLLTGGTGVETEIDGVTYNFSSAHEMRRLESESQKRAASGDGNPISFRALSQNKGNMDRNTLSGSQFERNKQIPHEEFGKTQRGVPIGKSALTREQAERMAADRR